MKICFTSALFCDESKLDQLDKPGHFERHDGYDYFLFTNLDPKLLNTSWDVINIADNKNISDVSCNIKKSRYTKFLSWHYFESVQKEYDVIFYCDAWIIPNNKKDWESLASKISKKRKFPFAQTEHNREVCRKGGINSEFERILISKRDTPQSVDRTKKILKSYDSSVDFDYPQYYENTCFGYKFKSKSVRDVTYELWTLYKDERLSYRDQPLWNFLLLRNKVNPIIQNDLKDNTLRQMKHFLALGDISGEEKTKYVNEHSWFIRKYENEGSMRENYTQKNKDK
tara:strand:+ start:21 stop:872 length:852 start_codon:yes stop_codon:yes gene_type:complete